MTDLESTIQDFAFTFNTMETEAHYGSTIIEVVITDQGGHYLVGDETSAGAADLIVFPFTEETRSATSLRLARTILSR